MRHTGAHTLTFLHWTRSRRRLHLHPDTLPIHLKNVQQAYHINDLCISSRCAARVPHLAQVRSEHTQRSTKDPDLELDACRDTSHISPPPAKAPAAEKNGRRSRSKNKWYLQGRVTDGTHILSRVQGHFWRGALGRAHSRGSATRRRAYSVQGWRLRRRQELRRARTRRRPRTTSR